MAQQRYTFTVSIYPNMKVLIVNYPNHTGKYQSSVKYSSYFLGILMKAMYGRQQSVISNRLFFGNMYHIFYLFSTPYVSKTRAKFFELLIADYKVDFHT